MLPRGASAASEDSKEGMAAQRGRGLPTVSGDVQGRVRCKSLSFLHLRRTSLSLVPRSLSLVLNYLSDGFAYLIICLLYSLCDIE